MQTHFGNYRFFEPHPYVVYFLLLVLKGIYYHCWKYGFIVSRGLKQMEACESLDKENPGLPVLWWQPTRRKGHLGNLMESPSSLNWSSTFSSGTPEASNQDPSARMGFSQQIRSWFPYPLRKGVTLQSQATNMLPLGWVGFSSFSCSHGHSSASEQIAGFQESPNREYRYYYVRTCTSRSMDNTICLCAKQKSTSRSLLVEWATG